MNTRGSSDRPASDDSADKPASEDTGDEIERLFGSIPHVRVSRLSGDDVRGDESEM